MRVNDYFNDDPAAWQGASEPDDETVHISDEAFDDFLSGDAIADCF